jgi:hypothetical protein
MVEAALQAKPDFVLVDGDGVWRLVATAVRGR